MLSIAEDVCFGMLMFLLEGGPPPPKGDDFEFPSIALSGPFWLLSSKELHSASEAEETSDMLPLSTSFSWYCISLPSVLGLELLQKGWQMLDWSEINDDSARFLMGLYFRMVGVKMIWTCFSKQWFRPTSRMASLKIGSWK